MRTSRPGLVSCAVVLALAMGCVPQRGVARGPVAGTLAIAPALDAPPPPTDSIRAPPPPEEALVDADAVAGLRASGRWPALALTDGALEPTLTTIALLDTIRAEARGLFADGGVRRVDLDEGQRATVPIALREDECVTIIVHAGLGILEVDAFVVAPAAPDGDILAMEAVGGPLAIVGGQAGCFRPRASGPAEVAVVARKGKGPVVAAIFRRPPPPP